MDSLKAWLISLAETNKIKVVEGKKDKIALEKFGVNNIITLSKPMYKIVEDISKDNKECILLVDLDAEGRKKYSRLKHNLQKYGVKVDEKYRLFLFRNTKIRQIEALAKYF